MANPLLKVSDPPDPPRNIKLPRHRTRALAKFLYELSLPYSSTQIHPPSHPITVVCISDTHNHQPSLPAGDILLHAGDLSENGSREEIQSQLDWLSSQSYKYKVIIAGNHDVLLDQAFLEKYPARKYGNPDASSSELDFGRVIYLKDEAISLNFFEGASERRLKIYGSPTTPQYVTSAFQVSRDEDVWSGRVPDDTDILLTHGPPWSHLDGAFRAGCQHLNKEVARVRPKLIVFGHIHVGYGQEDVIMNTTRALYEGVLGGWKGKTALLQMALSVCWTRSIFKLLPACHRAKHSRPTKFVNAAVVDVNQPIVVLV